MSKVKDNAEDMLVKIIEYVNAAESNEEDKDHLLVELACSLVTYGIDFDKDEKDILLDINNKCLAIRNISIVGALRYKSGDTSHSRIINQR